MPTSGNDTSTLVLHENKGMPAPIPYAKIVEAYGLRKCPKLIEQVAGEDLQVRVNALAVLCDEFNNGYSIFSCAQVGAIKILSVMVTDPDYLSRERASRALAIAARDANGHQAILEEKSIEDILPGHQDPSEEVRANVYECLYQMTRTVAGVEASVKAQVTKAVVSALTKESFSLKPVLLRTLCNIAGSEQGRADALNAGVVLKCIDLTKESTQEQPETVAEALRTLGNLCFDEEAKEQAIEGGAMPAIFSLLSLPAPTIPKGTAAAAKATAIASSLIKIKTECTLALMAISSTDEGKRQVLSCNGVEHLVALLGDTSRVLRLNALKVIANAAVYPPTRTRFASDPGCMVLLNRIKDDTSDQLLQRHATIALDAVNWTP